MKNIILKLISLILLIAMLLPMAVACADDPPTIPDNNGEGGNGNGGGEGEKITHIDAKPTGKDIITIADFSSTALISKNSLGERATFHDGKLIWNVGKGSVSVTLPTPVNTGVFHFVEFTVTASSKTAFYIKLPGCAASPLVEIEGAGTHDIKILCDSFSVKDPYPQITAVEFSYQSGSTDALTISNVLATTTTYELTVPEGVSLNDPAIYDVITSNYREMIVGKEGGYKNSSYSSNVSAVVSSARSAWDLFASTSDNLNAPETLFDIKIYNIPYAGYGTPYMNGGQIQDFYELISKMAHGYGMSGAKNDKTDKFSNPLYKDPELLEDILTALEYGYTFYYGKALAEGTDCTYGNWWEWDVGIPLALLDILVIIQHDISADKLKKYLSPFDTLVPHPMGTGANRTWMARSCILAGALEYDAMRVCVAKDFLNDEFYYIEDKEGATGDGGFYRDGSFVQHNNIAYTSGYGLSLIYYLSTILSVTTGSPLDFHGEHVDNQYTWIYESYLPLIYGINFFASVSGREVNRKTGEVSDFNTLFTALTQMQKYAPENEKPKLLSLIKFFQLEAGNSLSKHTTLPNMDFCDELYADDTVLPADRYIATKVFGQMDRYVHHGPKYGVCVSMSSTRIAKYESINGENATGWFHGDGMIYIYTDGYDYNYNFFWYANPYRMPGTTVNTARINVQVGTIGATNSFAGGVAYGKYGAAGYIIGIEGASQHTVQNQASTTGNKSYFTFDNEIICIGTGITDKSEHNVITTVENRIWREDDEFFVDNELTIPELNCDEKANGVRTMFFTNMGGYVFLRSDGDGADKDGNNVYFNKTYKSGKEYGNHADATSNRSFLEIVIDHGENPENGKYYYAYLPEATREETESYSDVELLAYMTDTHAVIEKSLGIIGANFFASKGGEVENSYTDSSAVTKIKTNKACSVMVTKNADGSYTVSVSDPTHLTQSINLSVTITGIEQVVSADNGVSATVNNGVASITVNTLNACGGGFNITLR